jgi:outer membrane protein assembly factor BamB
MRNLRFIAILAAIAVTLNAFAKPERDPNPSRNWPTFGGGPSRNMVNLGNTGIASKFDVRPIAEGGDLLWKAELGSRAYAGPVISGGKVFVGTNNEYPRNPRDTNPRRTDVRTGKPMPVDKGVLMCFEEATGKFRWQHVNDKMDDPIANDWPREGVCSTPFVERDRLWYVTNRGEVACLEVNGLADGNVGWQGEKYKDPTDADVIWLFDMVKELGVQVHRMAASSPLVVGDLVYVLTGNGVDTDKTGVPAPQAPSFIALNKNTGKLVWADNSPGENIMHGQWSSPAYGVIGGQPQVVFAGGDGWVRAFEPQTGKPLWKFDVNRKNGNGDSVNRLNHLIAMPVIWNDRVYIATGRNPESGPGVGGLWCIAPAGRSGDISTELLVQGGVVNNSNSGAAWFRGGPNPEMRPPWDFGRSISTVAIYDGLLYAVEISGALYCLDAMTGAALWRHDLRAGVLSSPLWVDGKILITDEDGKLSTLRHGREKAVLGVTEFDGVIHTSPVVANRVTYVMTEKHLYALRSAR